MKSRIFLFSFLAALFTLSSAFLIQNPHKHLIKKWQLDTEWLGQKIDEEIEKLAKVSPEEAEQIKVQKDLLLTIMGSMTMEFKEGGLGTMESMQGTVSFRWKLSNDAKKLTLIEEAEDGTTQEVIFTVETLNEKRLVLKDEDGADMVLIPYSTNK